MVLALIGATCLFAPKKIFEKKKKSRFYVLREVLAVLGMCDLQRIHSRNCDDSIAAYAPRLGADRRKGEGYFY
jgi:hypothetical protein